MHHHQEVNPNPNPNTLRDMSKQKAHLRVVNATYTVKSISNVVLTSGQVLDEAKNIEMRVTVGLIDERYGYFEVYDVPSDGTRFHAEGGLWFDEDRKLVDYDGCGELPDIVGILIRDEMADLKLDMSYALGDEVGTEKTMVYELFEYEVPETGFRSPQYGIALDHGWKAYDVRFKQITGVDRPRLLVRVSDLNLTPEQEQELTSASYATRAIKVPVKK